MLSNDLNRFIKRISSPPRPRAMPALIYSGNSIQNKITPRFLSPGINNSPSITSNGLNTSLQRHDAACLLAKVWKYFQRHQTSQLQPAAHPSLTTSESNCIKSLKTNKTWIATKNEQVGVYVRFYDAVA